MSEYITGALTALIGAILGYAMGIAKPYLDKRFNRAQKTQEGVKP